jgi:hypothetical protein
MSPVDALAGSVERANRGRSSVRLDLCWIRGTVPHVLASKYSRGAERGRERERGILAVSRRSIERGTGAQSGSVSRDATSVRLVLFALPAEPSCQTAPKKKMA